VAQLVDLVNRALSKLGAETIAVLSPEDSPQAAIAVDLAQPAIDELLSQHPWRFATQVRQLTRIAEDMPAGSPWAYQFAIPTDAARIVTTDNRRWEIYAQPGGAERRLYSDSIEVWADVVLTIEPAMFPAYVAEAAVDLLASKLAMPITRRPDIATYWMQVAAVTMARAKTTDWNERPWPEITDGDWLVNARFG